MHIVMVMVMVIGCHCIWVHLHGIDQEEIVTVRKTSKYLLLNRKRVLLVRKE